ncbi:DUF4844 domain-containing protein [Telluria sp. B2]
MGRDPLDTMADAPLFVVPRVLDGLRAFSPTFDGLPDAERARLSAEIDRLRSRLLEGIEGHPTKFWVMKQFQRSLEVVKDEDGAARKHFRVALDELMGILGVEDRSGVIEHYLGS